MRDETQPYAAQARRRVQNAARAGRRAQPLDEEHSSTLAARALRAPPGSSLALTFSARAAALQAATGATAAVGQEGYSSSR